MPAFMYYPNQYCEYVSRWATKEDKHLVKACVIAVKDRLLPNKKRNPIFFFFLLLLLFFALK